MYTWLKIFDKKLGFQYNPVTSIDPDTCATLPNTAYEPTDNWVIMKLSETEITQMITCLDNVAPILYPNDYAQINLNFYEGLSCLVTLCEAIVDTCFDDAAFQAALIDLLTELGYTDGPPVGGDVITEINDENLNINTDCTTDGKYGVAYRLAFHMNRITEDWLDVVELLANEAELAQDMVRTIPVVGNFLAAAIELADFLFTQIISSYRAAWTTATHDAVACEFYKLMCQDCEITLDDMYVAYAEILQSKSPPASLTDWVGWVDWIKGQSITLDDQIVAAMHMAIIKAMQVGSSWAGSTTRTLVLATSEASSIPPPVGCDCPTNWSIYVDWTVSEQGFAVTRSHANATAVYEAGNGWRVTTWNNKSNSIGEDFGLGSIEWQRMVFDVDVITVGDGTAGYQDLGATTGCGGAIDTLGIQQWDFDCADFNDVGWETSIGGSTATQEVILKGVCMYGDGPKPAFPDC